MTEQKRSAATRPMLVGAAVAAVVVATGILTYQKSIDVTATNPPQGNQCTSSPCQVPVSTISMFWHCWLRFPVPRLQVPPNTVVSWTLQPIGGDPVQFFSPYIDIKDPAGDFINRTASTTTVTWTASTVASGTELSYTVYAVRIKGGGDGSEKQTCLATNPLIVNQKPQ